MGAFKIKKRRNLDNVKTWEHFEAELHPPLGNDKINWCVSPPPHHEVIIKLVCPPPSNIYGKIINIVEFTPPLRMCMMFSLFLIFFSILDF